MASAGGGDEAGESGVPTKRHGQDRNADGSGAACQNLQTDSGSRERKSTIMSEQSMGVACEYSQRIRKENEDLRSQIDEDVKELGYCEENEKLRTVLTLKAEEMQCLRSKNEEMQATNAVLKKQNEELQTSNDGMRKRDRELQAENDSLTKLNEVLQAKNDSLAKRDEELKAKNIGLVKQNGDLQAKNGGLTKRITELQAKDDGLVKQIEELLAKNVSLEKQNEELQTSSDSMLKRNGELQAEIGDLTKRNDELQSKIDGLTKQNELLRAKNVKQRERVEKLQVKSDGLANHLKELEANNNSLRKHTEELEAKSDGLLKHTEELEAKSDGLLKQNKELLAKNDSLTKRNKEPQAKKNDIHSTAKYSETYGQEEINGRTAIGIKRPTELDEKPSENALKRKYGDDENQCKEAEMVSILHEEQKLGQAEHDPKQKKTSSNKRADACSGALVGGVNLSPADFEGCRSFGPLEPPLPDGEYGSPRVYSGTCSVDDQDPERETCIRVAKSLGVNSSAMLVAGYDVRKLGLLPGPEMLQLSESCSSAFAAPEVERDLLWEHPDALEEALKCHIMMSILLGRAVSRQRELFQLKLNEKLERKDVKISSLKKRLSKISKDSEAKKLEIESLKKKLAESEADRVESERLIREAHASEMLKIRDLAYSVCLEFKDSLGFIGHLEGDDFTEDCTDAQGFLAWLSDGAVNLRNIFSDVGDMASVLTLRAICQYLVEKGCEHLAELEVKNCDEYDRVSYAANEFGIDFYERFWLAGGAEFAACKSAFLLAEDDEQRAAAVARVKFRFAKARRKAADGAVPATEGLAAGQAGT